ncbi:MAG: replication initiator protein [Microvirus sp.]|nr:MAG: replication initiator protein [Microvirus sp.]
MTCVSPVWIQDKQTGGCMYVPCGRCIGCRLKRAAMWSVRIMHEVKSWDDCCFVTLTYSPENLPKDGSLSVEHCQKFFKRLRKNLGRKIKYFLGAEYGDLHSRPHYHVILFGVSRSDELQINQSWGLGFVHVGDVSHDSARYVASYTLKKLSGPQAAEYARKGIKPEFSLMSRAPGIGAHYVEQNKPFLRDNSFCIVKGSKVALPRYYSDKIYNSTEKALLHCLRSDFYEEKFQETKKLSGVDQDYQVGEYQRGQRDQTKRDLEARQTLKRRKL